ncbi:MAG: N-acetylneuraminate synthase family protein [Gaiellaceae bacterium]
MSFLPADRVFVIAEAGVTNYGDVELAHRQVDAAADAACDAVKFQSWSTADLVSRPVAKRLEGELGRDWYSRLEERELTRDDLREVRDHAHDRGLVFLATAHDSASVGFLVEGLDVPWLKIGSGEASNLRFLREVGSAGRPVLIAFGLSSDEEAVRAVETLRQSGAPEVIALHTVSIYPTPAPLARLDRIGRLRELLGVPIGISDHTVGWHVPLAAVALGACAIEKHLTFDKADPRSLDNPGALEPAELAELVRQVREVEAALLPVADQDYEAAVADSRDWALQAVVAARSLEAGTTLAEADLAFKRPARGGIPACEADSLLGRTLRRPVEADEQIRPDDLLSTRE